MKRSLKDRRGNFEFYSIALDESVDVKDTAQLDIFVRGVWCLTTCCTFVMCNGLVEEQCLTACTNYGKRLLENGLNFMNVKLNSLQTK